MDIINNANHTVEGALSDEGQAVSIVNESETEYTEMARGLLEIAMHHKVSFTISLLFLFFHFNIEVLRVGSLDISGGRDRHNRALVTDIIQQKRCYSAVLQETHIILMLRM